MTATMPRCRFGDGASAVGRFETPAGCFVYPDDRQQLLCWQHAGKALDQGARDGIMLREDYTNGWFVDWWRERGGS